MEKQPLLNKTHYDFSEEPGKRSHSKRLLPVIILAALVAGSLTLMVAFVDHNGLSLFSGSRSSQQLLSKPQKRNVIFMVSDGFGPASETFGRTYYQYLMAGRNSSSSPPPFGSDYPLMLPLDTIMVGQSRTRSANSWITDSAAGATAFSVSYY